MNKVGILLSVSITASPLMGVGDFFSKLEQAEAFAQSNNPNAAKKLYGEVVSGSGDEAERAVAAMGLGVLATEAGENREAKKTFMAILRNKEVDPLAHARASFHLSQLSDDQQVAKKHAVRMVEFYQLALRQDNDPHFAIECLLHEGLLPLQLKKNKSGAIGLWARAAFLDKNSPKNASPDSIHASMLAGYNLTFGAPGVDPSYVEARQHLERVVESQMNTEWTDTAGVCLGHICRAQERDVEALFHYLRVKASDDEWVSQHATDGLSKLKKVKVPAMPARRDSSSSIDSGLSSRRTSGVSSVPDQEEELPKLYRAARKVRATPPLDSLPTRKVSKSSIPGLPEVFLISRAAPKLTPING